MKKQVQEALTVEEAKRQLGAIQKRYEDDLNTLGERVRLEIVAPVAKRLKMRYTSGMGMFSFQKTQVKNAPSYSRSEDLDEEYMLDEYNLSEAAKETLRPVLDLLGEETEITPGSLGDYVGDAP